MNEHGKKNTLREMVEVFLDGSMKATDSPIGYLFSYDESDRELVSLGWSKMAVNICQIMDKPVVYKLENTGIWGDCVREGKTIVTNDYKACTKPTKKGLPEGHVPLERHMNTIVRFKGEIVAVVGVGNKELPYTDEDIKALEKFSENTWPSIEALLYKPVEI